MRIDLICNSLEFCWLLFCIRVELTVCSTWNKFLLEQACSPASSYALREDFGINVQ